MTIANFIFLTLRLLSKLRFPYITIAKDNALYLRGIAKHNDFSLSYDR